MRYRAVLSLVLISISTSTLDAQFVARLANPQVSVAIQHPPALQLELNRLLVRPQGQCSEEFAHYVTERFVREGVEVVDRQHLDAIFEEQHFGLSGEVDRSTMVELGKLAGATTLVAVNAFGCNIERQKLTDGTNYISQTRGAFRASVHVIDITTGRKFSARSINESTTAQNKSTEGYPVYPPSDEVQARLLRRAALEVHKWFFPWVERRDLYFFDNKDCGLKEAYRLLKIGDVEGAASRSEANVESCLQDPKAKPKRKAQAQYNLGMVRFIEGEYDEALKLLTKAYGSYPKQLVADAIRDCKRAQALAEEMRIFAETTEEESIEAASSAPPADLPAAPSAADTSLEERLQKLQELFEKGLVTEADYEAKKAEILESL